MTTSEEGQVTDGLMETVLARVATALVEDNPPAWGEAIQAIKGLLRRARACRDRVFADWAQEMHGQGLSFCSACLRFYPTELLTRQTMQIPELVGDQPVYWQTCPDCAEDNEGGE